MAVDFNHHISLRSSSLFLVCHHSPQSKVISLLVADDAQLLSERDDALHDLLLHQVEAHGQHSHPEEDVHEAEDELGAKSINRDVSFRFVALQSRQKLLLSRCT